MRRVGPCSVPRCQMQCNGCKVAETSYMARCTVSYLMHGALQASRCGMDVQAGKVLGSCRHFKVFHMHVQAATRHCNPCSAMSAIHYNQKVLRTIE